MTTSEDAFARQRRRRQLLFRLVVWPLAVVVMLTSSRWVQHPVWRGMLFLAGCVLVAVATVGRLWCSLYIGGYKAKELITSGPYSLTRNPLYFFNAFGAVGVVLATETVTVPLLLAVLLALVYPAIIRAEEDRLRTLHGEAYEAYLASVPRFWPRWSRLQEPEAYTVSPAKYRRRMVDAVWFVWLVGIVKMAEALRDAGILPTLLRLY